MGHVRYMQLMEILLFYQTFFYNTIVLLFCLAHLSLVMIDGIYLQRMGIFLVNILVLMIFSLYPGFLLRCFLLDLFTSTSLYFFKTQFT